MARKKKSGSSDLSGLLFAGLWAAVKSITFGSASTRIRQTLVETTKENLDVLVRRRAQLIQYDHYGNIIKDKWEKEIRYFISNNVINRLEYDDRHVAHERISELSNYVERIVTSNSWQEQLDEMFRDDMKPIEYEHYCADQLKRYGWDARVTMASRDQGVDVVAQKWGIRLVIQCKLYKSPVGNKAVQEVVAARAHESADYAIVVSNNRYTRDAEQLAQSNNVILLHHRDLVNIDKTLSISPPLHAISPTEEQAPMPGSVAIREAEAPLTEPVAGPYEASRLYSGALLAIVVISIGAFLTRDPPNKINNQNYISKETQASRIAAPSAAVYATSPSPSNNFVPNSPVETHTSTQVAPVDSSMSNVGSTASNLSTTKPSEEPTHIVVSDHMQDSSPTYLTKATDPAVEEPPGGTLAFRCRPATSGAISSIEISISGGNWVVSHIPKKGVRIERTAQYNIIDTSDGRDLSWQGVHRRNQELKMVAYLSHPNSEGSRVYKEEVMNANTGKVAETTATCEVAQLRRNNTRDR